MKKSLLIKIPILWVALLFLFKPAIGKTIFENSHKSIIAKGKQILNDPGNPDNIKIGFTFEVDKCKISFKDSSIYDSTQYYIDGYSWDFGDGRASSIENPTHIYNKPGTYVVYYRAFARIRNGNIWVSSYEISKTITVNCEIPPFYVKSGFGYAFDNCTAKFTDQSLADSSTTKLIGRSWDFGDGSFANSINPSHTYAAPGQYTVCLTTYGIINGYEWIEDNTCQTIFVDCTPPPPCQINAGFQFESNDCMVNFTDSSTANPETTINSYTWDFGDENYSYSQNPSHTYTKSGTYQVCLTIYGTNNAGASCWQQYCKSVTVVCRVCQVKADFIYNANRCEVSFADNSDYMSNNPADFYNWDFGDNTRDNTQSTSHTYNAAGTYNVCLTTGAYSPSGAWCTDVVCKTIEVTCEEILPPCELTADFTYEVNGCNVTFTDKSIPGEGTTIVSRYWYFGNDRASDQINPSTHYTKPGIYSVCLSLSGTNGEDFCSKQYCTTISVMECVPPPAPFVNASFKYTKDKCSIICTDSVTSDPGTEILGKFWNFGNSNEYLQTPTFTFPTSGEYDVCLIVQGLNRHFMKFFDVDTCIRIKVNCEDIEEPATSVFPVPTSDDVINVDFNLTKQGHVKIYLVEFNTGKTVANMMDQEFDKGRHIFAWKPAFELQNGNYIVVIMTPDGISRHKTIYLKR